MDLEDEIRKRSPKSYRETASGKFEVYISEKSKTISLGTYDSEEDASQANLSYRIGRLRKSITENGDNPEDGKIAEENYIAYPSGNIYNFHGHKMIGATGRDGYKHVIINGKNKDVHRVIADTFLEKEEGKEQINHKNGIKTDNSIDNLERCTRSENLKHAYNLGLEKIRNGEEHPNHKLTAANVDYIRKVYSKRDKENGAVPLSQKFNVDRTTILDIIRRKTWRNV